MPALPALRVACVGHAAVDHVFRVPALPSGPGKLPARAYQAQPGGMGLNAAVAAARLGGAVRLLGRVGDDAAGPWLRERLQREGVDVRGLETVAGARTSVSAVLVDASGERQICNHRGDALRRAHPLDLRQLEGADVLLVDPRWPAGALRALRWARRHGVVSVLDGEVAPAADLQRLVPQADWAVFSQAGLAAYAPGMSVDQGLQQAVASGARVALVTRGDQGSRRLVRGVFSDSPAYPVEALDTTAAGDVFHGALALALAEGSDAAGAVDFASAAAALKCRRGQGVLGAPTRAQLWRFVRAFDIARAVGRPAALPNRAS